MSQHDANICMMYEQWCVDSKQLDTNEVPIWKHIKLIMLNRELVLWRWPRHRVRDELRVTTNTCGVPESLIWLFFPLRSFQTIRRNYFLFLSLVSVSIESVMCDVKRSILRVEFSIWFNIHFTCVVRLIRHTRCWWHQDNRSAFIWENSANLNLLFIKIR